MKRIVPLALLLPLLALAPHAHAQGFGGGGGMAGMLNLNPVDLVLQTADSLQLGLTEAEVEAITAIRDEVDERNRPHREAVQSTLSRLQGGGTPDFTLLEQLQLPMSEIQRQNDQALVRVREMLTAEQVTKIDAMLEARRPRMGGGGFGGFGGGGFPG